jgi:hypothetical protein
MLRRPLIAPLQSLIANRFYRLWCPVLDHSSWMSNALAASQSQLSSPTLKQSSSAQAARLSCASQLAAKPDSQRDARSDGNRSNAFLDVMPCKIEDGKIPFNTQKMGRSSGYLALRYSVVDFVLLAKRYLSILKWIKSNFAWMKERWEHLHEQTMSCEEAKCYR